MIKIIIVGISTIMLSGASFGAYIWYKNRPEINETDNVSGDFEENKSRFISISAFKDGKVDGYLTFRAIISLKQKILMPEAEYILTDSLNRDSSMISKFTTQKIRQIDVRNLESLIFEKLNNELGDGEVGSFKIVDIFYDGRKT